MTSERRNRNAIPVVMALLTLTLAGSPARSGQEPDPVMPLASMFAAGALLNYDRAAQHYQLYLARDAMVEGPGRDESYSGSPSQNFQEIYYSRL